MSEPKFTPGPWTFRRVKASDDNHIVYCLVGPERAMGMGVGVAYAGTYGKTLSMKTAGVRQTDEECEANAHLISAAPELYRTLQQLHDNIAEYARINNLGGLDNQDMQQARAALAKARGEPS